MSIPVSVDLSVAGDPGVPVRVLFQWPPGETVLVNSLQAWVIMRREGGVLLALPDGHLDEESLAEHAELTSDGSEPLAGPHVSFTVPLLTMGDTGVLEPAGEDISVMVVDMNVPLVYGLVLPYPEEGQEEDLVTLFRVADPKARPDFSELMPRVKAWVDAEMFERTGYYSAREEEDLAPASPKATTKAKPSAPGSTVPARAPAGAKPGPKKHTVASLAQQVELLMGSLPAITDQLAKLAAQQERQTQQGVQEPADRAFLPVMGGKASMPISAMLTPGKKADLSGLAKMMGPPPPARASAAPAAPLGQKQFLEEDEPPDPMNPPEDMEQLGSPMAQALLQQSKALQTLMMHFHASGSDPMSDLSSSTLTTGVKGTMAREKLQRDLSAGNGLFFLKVCQQIQRRMSPTAKPPSALSEISGVSLLAYLERYGGYGQNRELGMIMWSIAHVFDAMAAGESGLAMDHLALTTVMVEQASLDSNKWTLAWLIRLLDDPPQNLWINRGQSATGQRRPFAPLSVPAWNTVALAFLKEAEILQGKRTELLGKGPTNNDEQPAAKPQPKRRPGRGKGAPAQNQQADDAK